MRCVSVLVFVVACSTAPSTTSSSPPGEASASSQPTAATEAEPPAPAPAPTAAPSNDPPVWVEPTAHEPEPMHAGLIEALGSAGACRASDMEKPTRALEWMVDGKPVYAAMCEGYAYQSDWELWLGGPDGMTAITVEGTPVRFLGMPAVSPGTGHVSWLTKDRGAGGCGSWHLLKLKGSSATELEHRSRECDEDPSPQAPEAWPIVP